MIARSRSAVSIRPAGANRLKAKVCERRGARAVRTGGLAIAAVVAHFAALVALLIFGGLTPVAAQDQRGRIAPEGASGLARTVQAVADRFMVSAANPHAVEAGVAMLEAGGSAVDAAIATQLVLNLVEPQSSGIGGGAFLVHFAATENQVTTYDGRETAPAAARPDRFLTESGSPMSFWRAVNSGLSVGVPGTLKVLELAHARHGRLPWARLFQPAIRLARDGFEVSPRLNTLLIWYGADRFSPGARGYFFDEAGHARPVGHLLKNPDFADTLTEIAATGAEAFYGDGPIARSIVRAVAEAEPQGDLVIEDITGYRAIERPPVCHAYRDRRICGMGPPSSGGLTVGQTLGLLDGFDIGGVAMQGRALHLIAEAEKLAYADRNRYIADPQFVEVPDGLLDDAYLSRRRSLISLDHVLVAPPAGEPSPAAALRFGQDFTRERSGTSHISIVDGEGNAVAMTTTIEGGFGSGLWASGFLLNNELTDFSFRPVDKQGRAIANRVEGGKRPRSSMAPTLVFGADGRLEAVLGSVGGSRIILYVAKSLVGLIDWNLGAEEIARLPNFGSRGRFFEVELGPETIWTGLKVKPYGHTVVPDLMTSGTHIVRRLPDGRLEGAADPRREGVARGG